MPTAARRRNPACPESQRHEEYTKLDEIVGTSQGSGRRRRRQILTAVAAAAAAGITAASVPAAYGSLAGPGRQHRPQAEAGARRGPTAYVATTAEEVVPLNLSTHPPLTA